MIVLVGGWMRRIPRHPGPSTRSSSLTPRASDHHLAEASASRAENDTWQTLVNAGMGTPDDRSE